MPKNATTAFITASLASIMLIAQPALAAGPNANTGTAAPGASKATATPANTMSERDLPNNAYVTLNGTVGRILSDEAFELNYQGGTIKVTTDETWDSLYDAQSANALKVGQRVTVSGIVDDNWFARKEIDAYAVSAVGQGGTTFSYNRNMNMDRQGAGRMTRDSALSDTYMLGSLGTATQYFGEGSNIMLSGTVSRVDGDDFWLRYSGGTIRVDADELDLPENRIRAGDRVMVQGEIEDPLFRDKQIEANTITVIDVYPITTSGRATGGSQG